MKKIFCIMILSLMVLLWNSCNKEPSHTLTMRDPDWLYEELPSGAVYGDIVTVKICKAFDVGYLFLVNGEKITAFDDTDDYWLFRFTMPDKDTVITFKTYDGFLPDGHYGVLIEAFWLANPDAKSVSVREYYGEYESGAIVAMIDALEYTTERHTEIVARQRFEYGSSNRLQVLYDGAFYTLSAAYESGYLTDSDIQTICNRYIQNHPSLYTEEIS